MGNKLAFTYCLTLVIFNQRTFDLPQRLRLSVHLWGEEIVAQLAEEIHGSISFPHQFFVLCNRVKLYN